MYNKHNKKVLIIGCGIAGSMLANVLKDKLNVIILTKDSLDNSSSMLAQGGIAVALGESDSPNRHFEDTLRAGSFYNDKKALKKLVNDGPGVLTSLINQGLIFDKKENDEYSYGLEGAHSIPRILHIDGDKTGKMITTFLHEQIKNVDIHENTTVIEILVKDRKCCGVKTLKENGHIEYIFSDFVVFATGGTGQLYPLNSNASSITGDGIAIAYRSGVKLKDLEFVQFHPTLLSINNACFGLVSEAVRGEGAVLVREDGTKIMDGKHPLKDLAPRDVVSRIIYNEILSGEKIYLDIKNVPSFTKRFPTITENLIKNNVPFKETNRIPIHPGAHFFTGGIKTDLNGETSVENLFAIGETACTGVHGANRLASNSLLEAVVFANSVAKVLENRKFKNVSDTSKNIFKPNNTIDNILKLPNIDELRKKAWECIGIIRTEEKLKELLDWLSQYDFLKLASDKYLNKEIFEIQNLCLVSSLIAQSALKRKKSLGSHFIINN